MTAADGRLIGALEACLFASPEPIGLEVLAEVLDQEAREVDRLIDCLQARYAPVECGVKIIRAGGKVQIRTKEEYGEIVARFLEPEGETLSPAALETLALVAYKQPITRPEVDVYRGVQSAHLLRRLEVEGLIGAVGRKDAPGRPKLYGTTERFLLQFGLDDLGQLPPLPDSSEKGMDEQG